MEINIKKPLKISIIREFVKYLSQSTFWIIIILICFEIGLRYYSNPNPTRHFDLIWGNQPIAGSTITFRTEGDGKNYYSSDGELATPFHGGISIPVLGDSLTEAYQVNENENFVSLAETNLRKKGVKVDLHNLGFSGGRLADYTYWASPIKSKYNPGIVVIQISPNDFADDSYTISARGNYFTKKSDGSIDLKHNQSPTSPNLFHRIVEGKSVLLGYGNNRYSRLQNIFKMDHSQDSENKIEPISDKTIITLEEQANYKAQLTKLHNAYLGQKVIIVTLPSSPKISDDEIVLDDKDYDFLVEQVKQFNDWYVVEPLPGFQKLWLNDHKLPRGFDNTSPDSGHMNVNGHSIVGQLLAEKIEEVLQ